MFDFYWKEKTWCIDAAQEDGSLGRLVNDDHRHPNCKTKRVITEAKSYLCLFALRDIQPGEEITYDYGGNDWPWRKQTEEQPCVAESSHSQVSTPAEKVAETPPSTITQNKDESGPILSSNKAGVDRHLVSYTDSDESLCPCTSSSQLNERYSQLISCESLRSEVLITVVLEVRGLGVDAGGGSGQTFSCFSAQGYLIYIAEQDCFFVCFFETVSLK
uniref:uncharacterized protein LOC124055525 n=1 Tax=Scatophagus argus TaxID=75038 RepID=UPI001ED85A5F|nr:uncharacterized protein LOC124055525 [Scatophagus argus]